MRTKSPLSDLSPRAAWIFWVLLALAVAARFTGLTTLSLWPLTDEAKSGYYSLELAQHGLVQMLYDFSQLPPFYIWLQGLVFKVLGCSLFSLWVLPAFLSLLTLGTAFLAAREWGPPRFVLVFTLLMAFGFWPIYVGRFSHPGSLMLLWEFLVLAFLGRGLRERPKEPKVWAWRLGLLTAGGFYTFTAWPTVALVVGILVLVHRRKVILPFGLGAGLGLIPLGIAWFQQDYGGYIQYVRSFDPLHPTWDGAIRGLSDLAAILLRSLIPENLFAYRPFWGGYLDPLLSASFLVGAFVFLKRSAKRERSLVLGAFGILYLPGFLTGGVEMFRILPLLPLVMAGAAWGLTEMTELLKTGIRERVLAACVLVSALLGAFHLFGAYHSVWTHPDHWFASKSAERLRAFQYLDRWRRDQGPGWVLGELTPDLYDQSLTLAAHSFNVELNDGLDRSQARWVALLTNVHYQPHLARLFPEGHFLWLASDLERPDGGLVLAVLPLPSSHPGLLNRWIGADRACHALVPLVFDHRDYKPRGPVLERLKALYPLFQGDPFLESCYWEKVAENHYGDRDRRGQVGALEAALQKGIPAAHLYNALGALHFRRGELAEARAFFEKALASGPDHSSAKAGLAALEAQERTGIRPRD